MTDLKSYVPYPRSTSLNQIYEEENKVNMRGLTEESERSSVRVNVQYGRSRT